MPLSNNSGGVFDLTAAPTAIGGRHRLDLDELAGIPRTATPSSVLGASWSPNAPRTTRQAVTRSVWELEATYPVVLATSLSPAPAAPSATARLAITR
jgi:hypothetical protein